MVENHGVDKPEQKKNMETDESSCGSISEKRPDKNALKRTEGWTET